MLRHEEAKMTIFRRWVSNAARPLSNYYDEKVHESIRFVDFS